MKRLSVLTFCLICLVCALTSSSAAEDEPVWTVVEKPPIPDEPKLQLAVGVGHQIGTDEGLETTGLIKTDFFYFVSNRVGLKFGVFYNGNMTGAVSSLRNYGVAFGPRVQFKSRLFTPYFETLYDIRYYYGSTRSNSYSNGQGGLSFAAGVSMSLGRSGYLDLTFRKVFNDPYRGNVYTLTSLPGTGSPYPDPTALGTDLGDFYDPASVEVQYRFKL